MDFWQLEINLYLNGHYVIYYFDWLVSVTKELPRQQQVSGTLWFHSSAWHWEPEISAPGEATGISSCYRYIISHTNVILKILLKGALWSFKVSVSIQYYSPNIFTHFLCPWGLTNVLSAFPSSKNICKVDFKAYIVYINIYLLAVFFFCSAFAGTLLCFLARYRHL